MIIGVKIILLRLNMMYKNVIFKVKVGYKLVVFYCCFILI